MRGSPEQQIADFYLSAADEARLDALGVAPVRAQLDRIEAIRAPADLAAEAGALTTALAGGPFALTVVVDTKTGGLIAQIAERADRQRVLQPGLECDLSAGGDAPASALRPRCR